MNFRMRYWREGYWWPLDIEDLHAAIFERGLVPEVRRVWR